mgnify:CR=1 FL=1
MTALEMQLDVTRKEREKFAPILAKAQAKGERDAEEEAEKAARRANRAANAKAGFSGAVFGADVLFLTKTFTTGSQGFHGTAKVMGPDGHLYQVNIQAIRVGSGNGK